MSLVCSILLGGCAPKGVTSFQQSMSAYPVGSDEARLIHDLEAKGFKYRSGPNGEKTLSQTTKTFACNHNYRAIWHADAAGKIQDITSNADWMCL